MEEKCCPEGQSCYLKNNGQSLCRPSCPGTWDCAKITEAPTAPPSDAGPCDPKLQTAAEKALPSAMPWTSTGILSYRGLDLRKPPNRSRMFGANRTNRATRRVSTPLGLREIYTVTVMQCLGLPSTSRIKWIPFAELLMILYALNLRRPNPNPNQREPRSDVRGMASASEPALPKDATTVPGSKMEPEGSADALRSSTFRRPTLMSNLQ